MDRTQDQCEIPDIVVKAYKLLLQHRIVTITETIRENNAENATGWEFKCVTEVPYPNQANIPKEVTLRVLISEEFPYEPIDFYPICEVVRGFPHQDSETGKLCLNEEDSAPRNTYRLVCYTKWAVKWLEDAANGMLLKPGDPYELPDFRCASLVPELPTRAHLIFEESSNTYETWKFHIGKFGHVECYWGAGICAIFSVRFLDKNNRLIRKSEFTQNILKDDSKIEGKWILVSDIRYERHRPPQTYEEIEKLCSRNGLDFYTLLNEAWYLNNSDKFGILLIGFPIPEKIGSSFTEIHWQPILFQNLKGFRDLRQRSSPRKPKQIWRRLTENGCLSRSQQLPWGRVENIATDRLYVRGSHPAKVQSTYIAFFGCGALGGAVAELLARGGVKQLILFDKDIITFGNLCRHTLDGSSVGFSKAKELANRLSRANPFSTIHGYDVRIPLSSSKNKVIHQVMEEADVFIDCTANETAFDWLNEYAVEKGKRLISLFFNLRAELLTICISGKFTSCSEIFYDLEDLVKNNKTTIAPDAYEAPRSEEIMVGAGCWHPTFPALNTHVQILAAAAVDIINHFIGSKSKKGLGALVERQPAMKDRIQSGQFVKIWTKEY